MTETPSPYDHTSPIINQSAVPMARATRLWMLSVAAGIVAGFISWLAGEAVVEHFKPETHREERYGVERTLPTAKSLVATEIKNAALAFAILGGALGLALGLAGGLARGSLQFALSAAAAGMVLSAVAGVIVSFMLVPVFQTRFDMVDQGLSVPLLTHGGIWGAIGAMAGLAMGIGLGGWRSITCCLLGGLAGGVLGAVAYELAGAVVFPLDKTYQPLSETASSRFLAVWPWLFASPRGPSWPLNLPGPSHPHHRPEGFESLIFLKAAAS